MAQQQEPPTTTTTTTTTSTPKYELLYHPGIPGRGEFIRLALESQKIPYTDIANPSSSSSSSSSTHENGYATVQRICMNPHALESEAGNPPVFSPPGLRVCFASKGGQGQGEEGNRKTLVISQTPNILIYLGEKIPGLVGGEVKGKGKGKGEDVEGEEEEEEEREKKKFWIQQLMMTALDLNNEVHDTHHPIAVSAYYTDQKPESLKKALDVRSNRIPKFLSYFERNLKWNAAATATATGGKGGGEGAKHKYLVGNSLTYADTTVWQVLDGLQFAFPKEMEARSKEFPELLGTFYNSVKEELKEYLNSSRRLKYSQGVYRYYPELDRQE